MGRVGSGDGDAVGWRRKGGAGGRREGKHKTREVRKQGGHTLEEAHGTVQALRRKLVIAEGAEKLRDDDVGRLGDVDGPHVAKDDLNSRAPFESLTLLESVDKMECLSIKCTSPSNYVRLSSRNKSARVFLDGVDARFPGRPVECPEYTRDQRSSTCTTDVDDELPVCRPVGKGERDGVFVVLVLDWIALKNLVRRALEVVHERLERRLKPVPVAFGKLVHRAALGSSRLLAGHFLEVADILRVCGGASGRVNAVVNAGENDRGALLYGQANQIRAQLECIEQGRQPRTFMTSLRNVWVALERTG